LRLQEAAAIFQQWGDTRREAIALTNLGNAQLAIGRPEQAQENLERAVELYARLGDAEGVKRGQIYRSQSLQDLGLFLQACETLAQPLELNDGVCGDAGVELSLPFHLKEMEGWRSFGEILRVLGKLEGSQKVLDSLADFSPNNGAILLSLGNTLRARGNLERDRAALPQYDYQPWQCRKSDPTTSGMNSREAIAFYKTALEAYQEAALSTDTRIKTQAQLNRLSLLLEIAEEEGEQVENARSLLSQIDLSTLPSSRQKIYAEINLAKSRACLVQFEENQVGDEWTQVAIALNEATREAHELHDKRAESYGLGELGGFYESLGTERRAPASYKTARELTEKALYLAQPQEAPDIAYQWQWQLGRLFAKQEERKAALRAYQGAVETLQLAREDLLSLKTDVQYSFRDRVEPLYRQYLDLLLTDPVTDKNLKTAVAMVEQLQLAELENFLRCRITNSQSIDEAENPPATIIYPILLKNRLEVIVKVPESKLIRHSRQPISNREMNDTLYQLSGRLADRKTLPENILKPAQ